jgi:hypothetical protein
MSEVEGDPMPVDIQQQPVGEPSENLASTVQHRRAPRRSDHPTKSRQGRQTVAPDASPG